MCKAHRKVKGFNAKMSVYNVFIRMNVDFV